MIAVIGSAREHRAAGFQRGEQVNRRERQWCAGVAVERVRVLAHRWCPLPEGHVDRCNRLFGRIQHTPKLDDPAPTSASFTPLKTRSDYEPADCPFAQRKRVELGFIHRLDAAGRS